MIPTNDLRVECGMCRHQWLALALPMPLIEACKAMQRLRCPLCDAPSDRIFVAVKPKEPTMPKPPVLMSPENPDGWKLEVLLDRLVQEIEGKCRKIEADERPTAQLVLGNNRAIITCLTAAAGFQRQSMTELGKLGPNQGPLGKPRIDVGSEP